MDHKRIGVALEIIYSRSIHECDRIHRTDSMTVSLKVTIVSQAVFSSLFANRVCFGKTTVTDFNQESTSKGKVHTALRLPDFQVHLSGVEISSTQALLTHIYIYTNMLIGSWIVLLHVGASTMLFLIILLGLAGHRLTLNPG